MKKGNDSAANGEFPANRMRITSSIDRSVFLFRRPIICNYISVFKSLFRRSSFILICLIAQISFSKAEPRRTLQPTRPTRVRNARVFIIYSTQQGHTEKMAEAVARGARSIGQVEVMIEEAGMFPLNKIAEADAIILGGPVHNANIDPQLQQFINKWPFKDGSLRNKIGAAFVTAGGLSAGEELAQLAILHSMLAFGMIVVGGDTWQSAFGASAILDEAAGAGPLKRGEISEYYLRKGEALGRRVSQLAAKQVACF